MYAVKIVAEPQLSVLQEMLVRKLGFENDLYNILGLIAVKLPTFWKFKTCYNINFVFIFSFKEIWMQIISEPKYLTFMIRFL